MADIEELVELVLVGQHPRVRERYFVDRITSVLESFGAFDAPAVDLDGWNKSPKNCVRAARAGREDNASTSTRPPTRDAA